MTPGRAKAYAAFRRTGIPRLVRATYARRRVTVLLYHDPRPETIERHLEYLIDRYTPVTIDEVSRALNGGEWSDLPPRPLLVTIDDGHRGNAHLADAFERYDVRPVIFLCSQIAGTDRRFWFNEPGAGPERFEWPHADRLAVLERTSGFLLDREYRVGERQALSSEEIARLGRVADYGAHTRFHPMLTSIPAEQSEDEIRVSKEEVARMTGRPCRHFAYPAGQYGPLEVEFVRRAGYETARTTDFGFVGPRTDPLRLPLTAMVFDESVDSLATKLGGAVYLRFLARRRPSGRAAAVVARPAGRGREPVTVRPLELELVRPVAELHREAFAGFLSARVGVRYAIRFLNWFRTAERSTALVAVDSDGRPLGYVVGAHSDYWRTMDRELLSSRLLGVASRPWVLAHEGFVRGLLRRAQRLLGVVDAAPPPVTLPEPIMDLVAIGVSPGSQGLGVGASLVRAFEDRARSLGMASVRLSVRADNAPALRLYERCGWTTLPAEESAEALEYGKVLA